MESSLVFALLACVVPIEGTVGPKFRFTQFSPNQPAKTCLVSGALELSNNIEHCENCTTESSHACSKLHYYVFVHITRLKWHKSAFEFGIHPVCYITHVMSNATLLMLHATLLMDHIREQEAIWDSALV